MLELINKTYYQGAAITFEISESGNVALWVNGEMDKPYKFADKRKAIKYIFIKYLDLLCCLPPERLDELYVWQPETGPSNKKFYFYQKHSGFQYSELLETPQGEPIATFLRPKLLCSALYKRYSNKYHQSKLGAPI